VYKGIPDCIRCEVWRKFTNCAQLKEENEGIYEKYISQYVDNVTLNQIDIDIHRSLRNHVLYVERFGPGQISLFRILRAYSVYDPEVGYCQGMSDITAFLLLYIEEEECFWLLTQLCRNEKYNMQGFFAVEFPGLTKAYYIHNKVLENHLPDLFLHLNQLDILPPFYIIKWLLKIFLDSLDEDLVRRIWDVVLYEGYYIMYTIIYVLLKKTQKN